MAGVILLTAMAMGGIFLWIKRRKQTSEISSLDADEKANSPE